MKEGKEKELHFIELLKTKLPFGPNVIAKNRIFSEEPISFMMMPALFERKHSL